MTNIDPDQKKQSPIARNWGKVTALVLALSTFLGVYDALRNQGRLFLCDLTGLVGEKGVLPICREVEAVPDDGDLLASLEYLKDREDELDPERLALLRRLETHFEDRAFAVLSEEAGLEDAPADRQAQADTREAVRETVEEGDPEERRAIAMIGEGNLQDGLQLLSDLATASARENAEQWRRIGRLAYPVDTARALDAYEKTIAIDQSNPWDAIYLGRLYERAGALTKARRIYSDALARLPESEERDRSVLLNGIGNVRVAEGDLADALDAYGASLVIRERLASQDPDNAGWQRDLSVSHIKIGDVWRAKGDLAGALDAYGASLAIFERLSAQDPGNAGWQRDLGISSERIGDVLVAQGKLTDALASYERKHQLIGELAAQDPGNAGWQRGLSISHNKIGDVRVAEGDLAGALDAYGASHAIFERLASQDPDNALWQLDLVYSHTEIGNAKLAEGDVKRDLATYWRNLVVYVLLAGYGDAEARRELRASHSRLAEVGDWNQTLADEGRHCYGIALTLARDLQVRGRLAPRNAWMIEDLESRLAALGQAVTKDVGDAAGVSATFRSATRGSEIGRNSRQPDSSGCRL